MRINNEVEFKKQRIVRVICTYRAGDSFGTGFFIRNTGELLTCLHVILGSGLKEIRNNEDFLKITGGDEHSRLQKFYESKISTLQVEFLNGQKVNADLIKFDERYDIALLKIDSKMDLDFFNLDTISELEYDDDVFFCGYQYTVGYSTKDFPVAVNRGVVSSFPEIIVCGEKYPHVQINSINLGGNSGAPVFRKGSNKVIAIVNGNMNWGAGNLARLDDQGQIYKEGLTTPLSIAYVTALKFVNLNSSILK